MRIEYKANRMQRTVRPNVGKALIARGLAKRVDEPQAPEPTPKAVIPEPEQSVEISEITGKPKRRYKRRDMQAAD